MNRLEKNINQQQYTKPLPSAVTSEMYLIGASMVMEGVVQNIFSIIRHWHFYNDDNKIIWKAITRMLKKDHSITKDLLYTELHRKAYFDKEIDIGYLQQCIDSVGQYGLASIKKNSLICHRELVFETFTRRQLIELAVTMQFYGFLPGGHTAKMLTTFDRRKERIEQAYNNANCTDDMDACRFDPTAPIEMEDYLLNFSIDGNSYGVAECGNIVSISGASGSRKTTLLTGLIASAYTERSIIGFQLQRRSGKILFFDTEQPKKRFQHMQRRLNRMCRGKNTQDNFEAYTLRDKTTEERLHFIDKVIHHQKEKISAIVIDGILDLVDDMNNLQECTKVIQKLMTWTSETGAIMFPVLHDVKSSGKMGGHLGSFLSRKQDAEINVNLDKDDEDYSIVKFRKTRAGRKPRSFSFTQDANGHPVIAIPVNDSVSQYQNTGTYDDSDVPF